MSLDRQMVESLLGGVRWTFEGTHEQHARSSEVASGPMEAEARLLQRVRTGVTVLDLGCAAGRVAIPLAENGAQVIGADIAHALLGAAAHVAHQRQLALSLVQCAPYELPFQAGTFDTVIFFKTYCYVPGRANRVHWLREIRRLLRETGAILFSQYVIDDALGSYAPVREDTAQRFPQLVDRLEEGDGFSAPSDPNASPWYIHYFLERDLLTELQAGGFLPEHGHRQEHIFYGVLKPCV